MTQQRLKFAIFGNVYQEKKSMAIQKLLAVLQRSGAEIAIAQPFYDFLNEGQKIKLPKCEIIEDENFTADFVVSLGGDGTFLNVASQVREKQIPILGINTGRLGFLATFLPEDIETLITDIGRGRYNLVSHSVIQLQSPDIQLEGCPFALNDIAILKHDNSSMISIRTSINGEYLTTYQADGLIVGTPTGSTAYSLSVGGPIVVPQSNTITLTAVAPHMLNMRPIVLCDDVDIELKVESRTHRFLVAVDGRSQSYSDNIHLRIRRAPYAVKVVNRHGHSFFQTLSKKMMWGLDQRG